MKSRLFILVAAAVLVLAGLGVFWYLSTANPALPSPTASTTANAFPGSGASGGTNGAGVRYSLAASDGGTVLAANFLSDPKTVKDPINQGYYYLGYHPYEGVSDSTATNTPPYLILYEADSGSFSIALLQEPIGQTRIDAEQYLMSMLGIPQDQLCRLKYSVSVPYWINSAFAGKNLGLSFCPDSVVLPQ
ncbi:MAG: hypothetical protein KGI41_00060 [Patescibacteria group bacterium]|nr:hypothetical protein [Patescibacteria group bacterium]MDE1965630.1 hypothetical protein [Patescibacteria group bacterium]